MIGSNLEVLREQADQDQLKTFILVTGRRDPRMYAIDLQKALRPENNNTPNAIVSRSKVDHRSKQARRRRHGYWRGQRPVRTGAGRVGKRLRSKPNQVVEKAGRLGVDAVPSTCLREQPRHIHPRIGFRVARERGRNYKCFIVVFEPDQE
jgi:hypothetical protein